MSATNVPIVAGGKRIWLDQELVEAYLWWQRFLINS